MYEWRNPGFRSNTSDTLVLGAGIVDLTQSGVKFPQLWMTDAFFGKFEVSIIEFPFFCESFDKFWDFFVEGRFLRDKKRHNRDGSLPATVPVPFGPVQQLFKLQPEEFEFWETAEFLALITTAWTDWLRRVEGWAASKKSAEQDTSAGTKERRGISWKYTPF